MQLTVTGPFAEKLVQLIGRDTKLTQAFAKDWIARVDGAAMSSYLLTPEVAAGLLAARLAKDPEGTVAALERMPSGGSPIRGAKTAAAKAAKPGPKKGAARGKAKAKAPAKAAKAAPKKAVRRKAGARIRLSAAQTNRIRSGVIAFLRANPGSNRGAIMAGGSVPTSSVYSRLMAELRNNGTITQTGTKAKAVYSVAGGKAAKAPVAKAKPKNGRRKAASKVAGRRKKVAGRRKARATK